jgi:hypothetical protein
MDEIKASIFGIIGTALNSPPRPWGLVYGISRIFPRPRHSASCARPTCSLRTVFGARALVDVVLALVLIRRLRHGVRWQTKCDTAFEPDESSKGIPIFSFAPTLLLMSLRLLPKLTLSWSRYYRTIFPIRCWEFDVRCSMFGPLPANLTNSGTSYLPHPFHRSCFSHLIPVLRLQVALPPPLPPPCNNLVNPDFCLAIDTIGF